MLQRLVEGSSTAFGFLLMALIWFPGGTIFMALMVPSYRIDGLDWVLSVVIPAYGLAKGIFG